MGKWTKIKKEVIKKQAHVCPTPHWGSVDSDLLNGSIWQCDCGLEYRLRWSEAEGSDSGMMIARFIPVVTKS